jgi:hypothetical protein
MVPVVRKRLRHAPRLTPINEFYLANLGTTKERSSGGGETKDRPHPFAPRCLIRHRVAKAATVKATRSRHVLYDPLRMNRGLADIRLEVRGGDIIVDLPGTSFTITYHKPAVSSQLLASYLPVKHDLRTELSQAEFLARALRLANDKARELGRIA